MSKIDNTALSAADPHGLTASTGDLNFRAMIDKNPTHKGDAAHQKHALHELHDATHKILAELKAGHTPTRTDLEKLGFAIAHGRDNHASNAAADRALQTILKHITPEQLAKMGEKGEKLLVHLVAELKPPSHALLADLKKLVPHAEKELAEARKLIAEKGPVYGFEAGGLARQGSAGGPKDKETRL